MKIKLIKILTLASLFFTHQIKAKEPWFPYPGDAFPYIENLLQKEIERRPENPWAPNVLMEIYESALYVRHHEILYCMNDYEKSKYLEDHQQWFQTLEDETKELWNPWLHGTIGQITGAKIRTESIKKRLDHIQPMLRLSHDDICR